MKRRKSPLEKLEEMEEQRQALMEFKKACLEAYIKTPMGKLSIWMLDKFAKFLDKKHKQDKGI